jgi:hypothetical protein
MSEPTTAAGRKMLGVLDSLMAVLHGIATADLPENIAAHAKTTDQVKEELAALVLAIEAEAATPAPLDGLPGLIAIHRAWHENPRYDIALDTPCPLAPLDEFECPGCGGRWRYQTRPDGSKAVEHLATPAPLDVDRLERALERVWTAGGVDPAWWVSAAAIAAAYAEETK